ncbi:MAG TPA: cell division protein FtsQ [Cytophagaceae bacterium]
MRKYRLKRGVYWVIGGIILFSLLGFIQSQQADRAFKNVVVNIDVKYDNYFVDEQDVLSLLTLSETEFIIGRKYEDIDLKELEERVKSHNFVEEAEVFKDYKGNLIVEVSQRRPIARIIRTNGPHAYITDKGLTIPTSDKFTSRVVLVDGGFVDNFFDEAFMQADTVKPYLELLRTIDKDKFLKAQIAQVTIEKDGDVVLHPQIGDERIELGLPENLELKLNKLRVYYKKILPLKGWNKYNKVNLKYKDQIICE